MAVDPLTYEKEATNTPLEVYEWDNVWWEQTNNTTAKRVLYIGDSISYCTRNVVTATANEEILVDGFATSKALDNPYFLPTLKLFMEQQPGRDAVLLNNGLHGWHLDEETGYRIGYRKSIILAEVTSGLGLLALRVGCDNLPIHLIRHRLIGCRRRGFLLCT